MPCALITGGSGFFGSILIDQLLNNGWYCINLDLLPRDKTHVSLISYEGDIRDINDIEKCFINRKIDVVFHCAALLAHGSIKTKDLHSTNVLGTELLARISEKNFVKKFVYISSNCLWGEPKEGSITEEETPSPCEAYGESKLQGEEVLNKFTSLDSIIFRVPTLIDEGRLGLLGLLFDFIADNKKIWVVGNGNNKYQFLYAKDLVDACLKSFSFKGGGIFNVGSDNVKTLKEVYQYVVNNCESSSKIKRLPKKLTILAMKLFYYIGYSPLGPYHWRMIAESFSFDTSKIKKEMNWKPTLTNEEILLKAYNYYINNREEIRNRENVSAHNTVTKAGIIRMLKFIS